MQFTKHFKMGGIGSLLGVAGGAAGTGFASPTSANIVQPFNAQSANNAAGTADNALQQQQAFLQAIQQQNGLGNQSNVYNQLQGVANGTGPNPAQAQLAQATGANTANQAALMAGQRGSGANAGLLARQAAMQGGANQQNAAGQAATMQANQSLNALGQMGGMANQMAGQQAQAVQGLNNAAQGQEGQILGAIQGQNNANVGMQSNVNSANAGLANTSMQGQQGLIGGALNALGPVGKMLHAEGGMIRKPMADGGTAYMDPGPEMNMAQPQPAIPQVAQQGPKSRFGQALNNIQPQAQPTTNYGNPGANALAQGMTNALRPAPQQAPQPMQQPAAMDSNMNSKGQEQMMAASGGIVPAMVSPGEKYLSPKEAQAAKAGANPMKLGETIPGKPTVDGAKNDYANDTVPKTLEEGGLVLPRSVTQSKNPEWAAHRFVRDHMAKGGMVGGLYSKKKKVKK